ncbi:MAG TPA: ABC transporter substrate-binding protein [Stellaceae bacterium]|nr:ABC transporter substrate-binding protein [Stellaceae bacterium]
MISRRRVFQFGIAAGAIGAMGIHFAAAATPDQAVATVRTFYDHLTATMKDGPRLGFTGRRDRLAPAIQRAFDLPRMTQLAVGPRWRSMSEQQHAALIAAFGAYSAATYASRFSHDSGDRFDVSPAVTASQDGDTIVHTKLVRSSDEPVQLDYLMKQGAGGWKIEDVYLSGTISELATRRSEFTAVLNRGGPEALVEALRKKAAGGNG